MIDSFQREDRSRIPVLAMAGLLIVLLARLYYVARFGTSGPFWDQWDAEFDRLLIPYLEGRLTLADFFAPHNEHRILYTRIVSLALFKFNDNQFDAKVEMFFNIVPALVAVALLLVGTLRTLPSRVRPVFVLAVACMYALPFGWENFIAGFQSQFYFLVAISIGALWLASSTLTPARIGILTICSLAGLFTMASGTLLPAVVAVMMAMRWLDRSIPPRTALWVAALQLVILALGLALIPPLPYLEHAKAQSLGEFLHAFLLILSWPHPTAGLMALVFWAPTLVLAIKAFQRLRARSAFGWENLFAAGLVGWVLLQALATSYSRGHDMGAVTPRYTDIVVVAWLTNFALAMRFAIAVERGRWRAVAITALSLYVATCAHVVTKQSPRAYGDMLDRSARGAEQSRLMREYLATRDLDSLTGPGSLFPYPDAPRIAATLDKPIVADFMPPDIRSPMAVRWASCEGFQAGGTYPSTPKNTLPSLGSYDPETHDRATGRCVSAPLHPRKSYVVFEVAGYPDGSDVGLQAQLDGHPARGPSFDAAPRESWAFWPIATRGKSLAIQAFDGRTDTWVAFTPPVEVGPLSAFSLRISTDPRRFVLMLIPLIFVAMVLAVVSDRRPTPAVGA